VRAHAPAKTANRRSTIVTFLKESSLTSRKRKFTRLSSAPNPQLVQIRDEFRALIAKLKALGCEDSMILVEFWHALDRVNGEDCSDV
jgi:hypothetical protein